MTSSMDPGTLPRHCRRPRQIGRASERSRSTDAALVDAQSGEGRAQRRRGSKVPTSHPRRHRCLRVGRVGGSSEVVRPTADVACGAQRTVAGLRLRGGVAFTCLALTLAACGGSTQEVDDDGADLGPTDAADVGEPEFPQGAEVDANAAWLARQCENLCLRDLACGQTPADTCVEDCLTGPALHLGTLACLLAADCGDDACHGPVRQDRNCPTLCQLVDDCGGFPSEQWGPDPSACEDACSGYAQGRPDRKQAEFNCYGRLLRDECRLDDVGQCRLDTGPDDACAEICGRITQECRAIPGGLFLTLGACLDQCRALQPREGSVLQSCLNITNCDRHERCWPPALETPADCAIFCDSFLALCPQAGVTAQTCPGICAGIHQALPGAALAQSGACIDAFDSCPEGDAVFACLLPQYEGCTDICGALEACGSDVTGCDGGCRGLAATYPEDIDAVRDCARVAACAQLGTCFQALED